MTTPESLTTTERTTADALYQAYTTQQPLLMADYTGKLTDYDSAYRTQWAFTENKHESVGGYKVSLTSEETQKMFDSDSPFYGVETAKCWLTSGSQVPLSDLMAPLLEVELVFTATQALTPEDDLPDLLCKTTVAGAVELPDSRFKDWFPELNKYLVVADSAVAGRVVYGQDTDAALTPDDLATVNATLTRNGEELGHGASSEVLGNPLNSLKWLVGKLAAQGHDFPAGTRVSSGTFLLPPHATKGDYVAHFDKFFPDVTFTLK